MKQIVTYGIILRRTDYGEADRILTLLTPDHGKLSLLAKGVRRIKSKLAGGIELFSTSDITYMAGRGEIGTLLSSRLRKHYGHITSDINRTMLGYDLIKQLNKATEDETEPEYYELLEQGFAALNDTAVQSDLIRVWFTARLLRLAGHTPNLTHDAAGNRLLADKTYDFNFEDMSLVVRPNGNFNSNQVKFLRLLFSGSPPHTLTKVQGSEALTAQCLPLLINLSQLYIRT